LVAISLFAVDMLALTARPVRLWAAVLRSAMPALLRCAGAGSVPPWTLPEGR
jgi:hypothetical protein